jgi:sarcosine oxidase subunit beta
VRGSLLVDRFANLLSTVAVPVALNHRLLSLLPAGGYLYRCPMAERAVYDVIVIGAGVLGSSIALELARSGHTVLAVDRGPGAGTGSTSASSAVVRFNYSTWTGVVAAWESKHLWEGWRDHLGARRDAPLARFVRTGGLFLESSGQDRAKVLALFDLAGIPYEEWDASTIRRRIPQIDVGRYFPPKRPDDEAFWADADGELTGCWTPDSGFIDDPQLAAENLAVTAMQRGAHFRFRSDVVEVCRDRDAVDGVLLQDGSRLYAPVVINVAGPGSSRINALADRDGDILDEFGVTTRPMRQEVHHVTAPPGFGHDGAPGPLIGDLDLGTYFRGAPGGGLLVGGTEPDCDPLQWLDDADDFDPNPTTEVHEAQVLRAARRLPELGVPDRPRGVAGVYDVTDDWIPIYDRTALPGYYVAVGTSGNQFKNAPVVGRFLRELVTAVQSGHDHDQDPVQVRLDETGHVADLGHYSRLRKINRDSSFSVMG